MAYQLVDEGTGEAAPVKYTLVPEEPAVVSAGKTLNDIPRQLGLTARYGMEGLANTAQVVTEPLRYITDRLTGMTGRTKPLGAMATQAADAMGLPAPQNATERVIGDASRLVAGAGGMVGAAGSAAGTATTTGANLLRGLAANPAQQLSGAAGAGLVAAEIVYTVTDPPIKLLRRIIPPLRIGAIAIDFAFAIVMLACFVLLGVTRSFAG